jgi:hypothetical protein
MLRPTQVVFGFLLFISIIAGGVMLFPSEQPDVPAPPGESPHFNPITPKDKTQTQQFAQEAQTIIRHLKAIEMLLTPDNNAPSPTKNIQTIADKLSTIETLLKPPESLLPPSQIPSFSVALPHGLIISVALIVSIAAFAPVLVKRTLVGTIESYRSNVGLAQARAEWVHKILESNAILRAKPIITLNSGPSLSLITVANDSEKLALDRAVQVCALWQKKL